MRNNQLNSSLDETDRTILRLLQEDGTLSNAKLAERLSLSVTPCWRRIRRLEEEGFIDGYQANLNRRKLGFGVLAFVQLSFDIHTDDSANRFEKAVLSVSGSAVLPQDYRQGRLPAASGVRGPGFLRRVRRTGVAQNAGRDLDSFQPGAARNKINEPAAGVLAPVEVRQPPLAGFRRKIYCPLYF